MTEYGETPQEALARLEKEKATGTLTIHIASGQPKARMATRASKIMVRLVIGSPPVADFGISVGLHALPTRRRAG